MSTKSRARRSVMVINDVRYVEAKSDRNRKTDCEQCTFAYDMVGCSMAVTGHAANVFGGDCVQREVIYKREPAHV